LHILYLFHFTDNKNEVDGTGKNSDTLLKIFIVFKILNMIFSKFYNPSEHLAADEVTALFKGMYSQRTQTFQHTNTQATQLHW
jgi:hypothetical protein